MLFWAALCKTLKPLFKGTSPQTSVELQELAETLSEIVAATETVSAFVTESTPGCLSRIHNLQQNKRKDDQGIDGIASWSKLLHVAERGSDVPALQC